MTQRFTLRSYEFRREREAQWRELEALLERAEKKGVKRLSSEELRRLPALYRAALSSLSVARAISLDKNVIQYLEGLCARAYFMVYARKRRFTGAIYAFFAETFPRYVREIRWALALSIGLLALGTASGFILTRDDSARYFTFVDEAMAQDRTPASSAEELREVLYSVEEGGGTLAQFAAFLFTHNAKIGLVCVALGFAAGVPVLLVLFLNGLTLGAMWAIYADRGLGFEFITWVLPHGVTELLAVAICGAAGLSIGYGLIFPGRYRRLDNLAIRGRRAGAIAVGAVAMFFLAALIEGFFRQLVQDVDLRVVVIAVTAMIWLGYFGFAGRRREERLARALLTDVPSEGGVAPAPGGA